MMTFDQICEWQRRFLEKLEVPLHDHSTRPTRIRNALQTSFDRRF